MRKLLRFINGYKKEAFFAPLFKLTEAVLELFVPLCVASLINVGIQNGDKGHIIKMALLMIGLGLLGLLASVTAQFFSAKAATGFALKMKNALFSHIENLSAIDRDKLGTSTLMTRLTSDSQLVQNGINMFLRLFLRSPFVVLGAAVMAFTVDSTLAWIFVIIIPLLSAIVFFIMRYTVPMYKKVQRGLDRITGKTRENLSGVRVIRAFCKEEDEKKEYREALDDLYDMQLSSGLISALLNPITYIIINLAVVVIVYFSYGRFKLNLIATGSIIALVNYMNQILVELVKLANLIITITRALAAGERIQAVFDISPSIKECDRPKTGDKNSEVAYSFDHVFLSYTGEGRPSLSDIDFSVKKGEKLGIIGGTGSGKTSLINLLPRVYEASSGTVSVLGVPVKEWDIKALRSEIAVVPQKAMLFKGTIRDNLKWGNDSATDEEIITALKRAEAFEFVAKKEGFLDFMVEARGKNLSGGQRQRLSIARALLKESASIIILDDSASALDYKTESKLRENIKKLDKTLIVVSQRTSSLLKMDRIAVLDKGVLVDIAPHEVLLERCQVYKEIYNSQFGSREGNDE